MHADQDYRELLFKLGEASQPAKKQWIKLRETLDTAVLGTIATSVGIVALVVVIFNLAFGYTGGLDGRLGSLPPLSIVGIAVIVGEAVGVAGLALGTMRDGTIPPLSAVGTIVCLTYLFFGQFVLAILMR